VDKPLGLTSHDVVARVRRALGGVKVGHAGTLDPGATGVLVVCVGRATKISSFLMEAEKVYEGLARLGTSTDTQDASGEILEEREVRVTEAELREAARRYRGELDQVPPMYSALKVAGQKLYRLARQGVEVARAPRRVVVHEIEIEDIQLPDFRFRLRCSKGTYVRTLLHDLGAELGCGGHLRELRRSRQGIFVLERAVALDDVTPENRERILQAAVSPEEALSFLPLVSLPPGTPLPERAPSGEGRGLVRLAGVRGRVEGIARVQAGRVEVLYRFPPPERFGRTRRFG
jgi:tRNA pseudouridine55 synthase